MTTIDVESYLTERVDGQIAYYEQAAGRAKRMHRLLQSGIIVLSVMVPVVVNRPVGWAGPFQVAVLAVALLLPIMTGLANFRKYGEAWLSYRTAAEMLQNEKYLFLTGSGRYHNNPNAFQDLVETVESLLSAEHNKFRALFADVRHTAGEKGGESAPAAGERHPHATVAAPGAARPS
jgi:hypothetical protein